MTYEEYKFNGKVGTLYTITRSVVSLAGLFMSVFVYHTLTEWHWFNKLIIFNIFILVATVPLPTIGAYLLTIRIKRLFVWLDVGRRDCEKRDYTY